MPPGSDQRPGNSALRSAVCVLLSLLGVTWGLWTLWRDPPEWACPPRSGLVEKDILAVMSTATYLMLSASNRKEGDRLLEELRAYDLHAMERSVAHALTAAYFMNLGAASLLLMAGAAMAGKRLRSLTTCMALVIVGAFLVPVPYATLLARLEEPTSSSFRRESERDLDAALGPLGDTDLGKAGRSTFDAWATATEAQRVAGRLGLALEERAPAWRILADGAARPAGILGVALTLSGMLGVGISLSALGPKRNASSDPSTS